jgi:YHS domain-containing protein
VQQKPAAADAAVQEAEQALKSVAEENPFTGVILEQQKETLPEAIQFEEAEAAQQPRVAQPPVFEPSLPAEPPAFPAAAPATTETEAGAATAGESQAAPSEQLRSLPDEKLRVAMENDERQKQLTRIRERGQQTGFKGFCPVALRDHRELIDADSAITAQFGLQTYSFSSEQARSLFEADPTRYAPASGGCDVVVLAREGVERPGRLDFALWFRGRLYMFETRDSMSEFHASPRTFAVEQ